jgi:hypothetical protein
MKGSEWIASSKDALRWSASAYRQTAELRKRKLGLINSNPGSANVPQPTHAVACSPDVTASDLLEVHSLLEQERELEKVVRDVLSEHPAWPWLQHVPGLNFPATAELLAHLDIGRAGTPSSFWSYCGFATVAGVLYECGDCGAKRVVAASSRPPARHGMPQGSEVCRGRLRAIRHPTTERLPQATGRPGEQTFNPRAKRLCYEIAGDLRQAGHNYDAYYRYLRQILAITRAEWPESRCHMNALRRMQKLFLAHLWVVWGEALRLPIPQPDNVQHAHHPWSCPWGMIVQPTGA